MSVDEGTGVYAQLHVRPWERLGVLFGGRYDWADSAFENRLAPGSKDAKKDQEFTWRTGLTFDVWDNVTVYGLYAESFNPAVAAGRNGLLDPQTGEIYEAGIKTEWFAGRLGINAALFRIDRDNVPVSDPSNGPGEFFSISTGFQRSDGVELEINGEPLPGWNLSFGGILLDSEFLEPDDPFFGSKPAAPPTGRWGSSPATNGRAGRSRASA
ncbi:MAG: TonB-dependent siderophore receptor [Gammaproteobacteria bacterium]